MHEVQHNGQQASQGVLSRRGFLTNSAKMLGGGALAMSLVGAVSAVEAREAQAASSTTDIDLLNYALTLENLERRFYVQVTSRFSSRDFRRARIFDGLGSYLRNTAYRNFQIIRQHEEAHVHALRSTIVSLGGTPVPECTYNFGVKSVADVVRTARVLENTGVMAYDGAIAYIKSPEYVTVGATIATIEARHASYLNLINRAIPFPASFDTPKSPQDICKAISPFIVKCPFDLEAFCSSLPATVITP